MTIAPDPLDLIEDAMLAKLLASADVTAICGQRVFIVQQEPGTMLPYIKIQLVAGGSTNDSPRDNVHVFYQVVCYSTLRTQATQLNAAARQALDRQQLALEAGGWNNYWLTSGDAIRNVAWGENNKAYGMGYTYEIQADALGISPPPGLP